MLLKSASNDGAALCPSRNAAKMLYRSAARLHTAFFAVDKKLSHSVTVFEVPSVMTATLSYVRNMQEGLKAKTSLLNFKQAHTSIH